MNHKRNSIGLKHFVLIGIYLFLGGIVSAQDSTLTTLSDADLTLSQAGELHLTSSTEPISNSSVNITHEDAWVFFDNIKPSVVISKYLSSIKINGADAVDGTNVRIAIYSHGAVVMPFGNDYKPLTVYTDEGLQGDSTKYSIHVFNNELGDFNDKIQSFKLKRGYMATFADKSDGTGYSRVFIADNADLIIDAMPDILNNSVSFIRVLKYNWVNKKGKAGWNPNDLDATTYYDWNIGGGSSADVEYVAIRQNAGWPSFGAINYKENISHVLGFNEPDRPDQSNVSMDVMIAQWPELMKSGLRIGSPAWASAWNGVPDGGNLFDFINICDELNYRVDFVALHCYWGGKSPQSWYNDLKYIHDRTGRPLWITEWNNGANWTTEWWPDDSHAYTDANAQKQLNDMRGILQVLDTASFIERYFIYDWVQDCRAMVLGGGLTLAGEYYKNNKSEIAFSHKHEVIPHWTLRPIELTYEYSYSSGQISLSWTDPNGGISQSYILERKIGDGDFEKIKEISDEVLANTQEYVDVADRSSYGITSYRVRAKLSTGEVQESNTVSYVATTKEEQAEFGQFLLNNESPNTCLFSENFGSIPQVIMGPLSYNSPGVASSPSIYPIVPAYCQIDLKSFNYSDGITMPEDENIGFMAIPTGIYSSGTMEYQANSVRSVKDYWKSVTFEEEFSTTPVVFTTQTTRLNTSAVAIAIRNVSTTGFEVMLRADATYEGFISSEKISYLAVTPGEGVIGKKRVTVDVAKNGITAAVAYNDTYDTPVLFANMQTSNDNLTSILRYKKHPTFSAYYINKKEVAATQSTLAKEDIGYMVVDISDDQLETSIEAEYAKKIEIYPNPATDVVNFNFLKPTLVKVYDMAGHLQLMAVVSSQLDISELPAGNYCIKVEGYKNEILTKTAW